jgi:hypothetical protein
MAGLDEGRPPSYTVLSMSTEASTTQPTSGAETWTLRGLIARHKLGTFAVAGLCALLVIPFVLVALGSKAGPITDATTCTQWGNDNQTRQAAYARVYLREHGPIRSWGGSPADVINAINWGCGVAYGDDVGDTATFVQATNNTF